MSASQHTSATRHVTPPSSLGYTFNLLYLLPSATKLRRLCFHRRVSVHGGGGVVSGPGRCLVQGGCMVGGCLGPGGARSWGCLVRGGLVSQHALRQTPPGERRPLLWTVRILLECILVEIEMRISPNIHLLCAVVEFTEFVYWLHETVSSTRVYFIAYFGLYLHAL